MESHNHPSAIEPYGGSSTGIGGILRDIVCMGAQPIALIDPLFFGPQEKERNAYIFSGVVSGIRDYGNRVGIPTCAGMIHFDDGYTKNCVVNVGCIGIVRRRKIVRSRAEKPGDLFVLAGGRTGRDGIHGVTFASAELSGEEESRSAVQLGNPIIKEPLIHAVLDCVEKDILTGLKDLGGGGLSCSVGELASAGNLGAEIYLERVPLKEEGMLPWEIWVSESQERFMLVVEPEKFPEVREIFDSWDVEVTSIGKVIQEKVVRVFYNKNLVLEIDTDFLSGPEYRRAYKRRKVRHIHPSWDEPDYEEIFLRILSSPNVSSKESVIRQYDHEVRGATITKPMQGELGRMTHGDCVVLKPLKGFRGIALSSDINPSYTKIDPYWGAASAVDETCRNLSAGGATPHSFVDCLNFGNPEKEEVMGDFVETCRALGEMASLLGIPWVSGNVSFYNESGDSAIPPTPTILGIGTIPDVRKCCTVELKEKGNPIYLIGRTREEVGGSEYAKVLGKKATSVPVTDARVLKRRMLKLISAIRKGCISACHDLSEGGLAVCIAEMVIGSRYGAGLSLDGIENLRSDFKLFSESNTRWLAEVRKEKENDFLKIFRNEDVYRIGKVRKGELLIKDKNKILVQLSRRELRSAWESK
jgi:phosphoribosylformylglycinamidine synthase